MSAGRARAEVAGASCFAGADTVTLIGWAGAGAGALRFDGAAGKGSASGKTNVVAARAVVTGDLRALTNDQFTKAKATMTQIVSASLAQTKATISFDEGYPPLAPTAGNERLLVMYDKASRDLGLGSVEAVSPDRAGAADVSFVAGHIPMIIDAVGMKGRDDHSPSETADLRTLAVQAKRAAVLLSRLGR